MKSILLFLALCAANTLPGPMVNEATPRGFAAGDLILYQTNEVLTQRVPDVGKFADYVKKLETLLQGEFASDGTPENFFTVVAIRPNKRVGVWFVSSKHNGTNPVLDSLRKKLAAVEPVEVRGGPVAFAIVGKLAGGDPVNPPNADHAQPVLPKEWQEAAKNQKTALALDDYLNLVWP